jgi:hypothetical protein
MIEKSSLGIIEESYFGNSIDSETVQIQKNLFENILKMKSDDYWIMKKNLKG